MSRFDPEVEQFMIDFHTELNKLGMNINFDVLCAWKILETGDTNIRNNPMNIIYQGSVSNFLNNHTRYPQFKNSLIGPVNNVGIIVGYPNVIDVAEAYFYIWSEFENGLYRPYLDRINATGATPMDQINAIIDSPWGYNKSTGQELINVYQGICNYPSSIEPGETTEEPENSPVVNDPVPQTPTVVVPTLIGKVPLTINPLGNQYLLTLSINGKDISCQLDTGSFSFVFPQSVADELGLTNKGTITIQTPSGQGNAYLSDCNVVIGNTTYNNVNAIIDPAETGPVLVGANLWVEYQLTLVEANYGGGVGELFVFSNVSSTTTTLSLIETPVQEVNSFVPVNAVDVEQSTGFGFGNPPISVKDISSFVEKINTELVKFSDAPDVRKYLNDLKSLTFNFATELDFGTLQIQNNGHGIMLKLKDGTFVV